MLLISSWLKASFNAKNFAWKLILQRFSNFYIWQEGEHLTLEAAWRWGAVMRAGGPCDSPWWPLPTLGLQSTGGSQPTGSVAQVASRMTGGLQTPFFGPCKSITSYPQFCTPKNRKRLITDSAANLTWWEAFHGLLNNSFSMNVFCYRYWAQLWSDASDLLGVKWYPRMHKNAYLKCEAFQIWKLMCPQGLG